MPKYLKQIALLLLVLSPNLYAEPNKCVPGAIDGPERASWFRGNWGIRFVIPGGDTKDVTNFSVSKISEQISKLKSPKWVMVNLTMPSWGGYFTSPNPNLEKEVDPRMVPSRDLLGEMLTSLQDTGFYTIVYFASQGPSMEFLSKERLATLRKQKPNFLNVTLQIEESWKGFLKRNRKTNQEALAEIIEYYSMRFGTKINGWWFDHGAWGEPQAFAKAARSGNPDAAVAWNSKHNITKPDSDSNTHDAVWMLTRSNSQTDYTDGHITPTVRKLPWWKGNEQVLLQMEDCTNVDGAVPHFFVPLQSTWRGGKELFPANQAISWTLRAINSGGAITWAAALAQPEFKNASISATQLKTLSDIDSAVLSHNPELLRHTFSWETPQ